MSMKMYKRCPACGVATTPTAAAIKMGETKYITVYTQAEYDEAVRNVIPDIDPITRMPFFMFLVHPERGLIPTYGGPYDSYTLCEIDEEESTENETYYKRERYDHDDGSWVEGFEVLDIVAIKEGALLDKNEAVKVAKIEAYKHCLDLVDCDVSKFIIREKIKELENG